MRPKTPSWGPFQGTREGAELFKKALTQAPLPLVGLILILRSQSSNDSKSRNSEGEEKEEEEVEEEDMAPNYP